MESSVGSKFTTHFRAVLANIDIAFQTMSAQLSSAVRFMKSMPKLSADEEAAVQAHQDVHSQELVSSWTVSLDAMPPTGLDERKPSLRTRSHAVNERTAKILPCASPTGLNASNEESSPTSPLECAALDSLRFLGISLMPCPLLAVHGIDYRDSSYHMPACSTLRNRGLSDWRDARTSA